MPSRMQRSCAGDNGPRRLKVLGRGEAADGPSRPVSATAALAAALADRKEEEQDMDVGEEEKPSTSGRGTRSSARQAGKVSRPRCLCPTRLLLGPVLCTWQGRKRRRAADSDDDLELETGALENEEDEFLPDYEDDEEEDDGVPAEEDDEDGDGFIVDDKKPASKRRRWASACAGLGGRRWLWLTACWIQGCRRRRRRRRDPAAAQGDPSVAQPCPGK